VCQPSQYANRLFTVGGLFLVQAWRAVRDSVWPGFLADREHEWDEAYARWAAVLPRCATRMEVHDVMSELFAELGCSHACAYLPPPPPAVAAAAATLRPGSLGADLVWDQTAGGYRVQSIVRSLPPSAWSASYSVHCLRPEVAPPLWWGCRKPCVGKEMARRLSSPQRVLSSSADPTIRASPAISCDVSAQGFGEFAHSPERLNADGVGCNCRCMAMRGARRAAVRWPRRASECRWVGG
jgi:hypothetical protein